MGILRKTAKATTDKVGIVSVKQHRQDKLYNSGIIEELNESIRFALDTNETEIDVTGMAIGWRESAEAWRELEEEITKAGHRLEYKKGESKMVENVVLHLGDLQNESLQIIMDMETHKLLFS